MESRDVIEGFATIGYKRKFIDVAKWSYLAQLTPYCIASDDMVISFSLAAQGINRYMLMDSRYNRDMVRGFEYGYEEDALHRGAGVLGTAQQGDAFNTEKYRKCFAKLCAYWR